MAGDWMKIELELPDKPEVHAIASRLTLDPDAVVGKLIRVWQWFDKQTTDGNAAGVTYLLLDRITGVSGFGEAMISVHWLEQIAGENCGLTMPKFDRHTSESAKKRALTAKRVAKSRNSNGNAAGVTEVLPEKRREEKNSNAHRNASSVTKKTPIQMLQEIGVPEDIANDWLVVRKAKRAPLTKTALSGLVAEAQKAGITPAEAVTICAKRGWQGFNAGWDWQSGHESSTSEWKST